MPEARARDVHELKARAEQGDVSAQLRLGTAYVKGRGVQQNDAEALKWYRLAAEQGEARAHANLALMYEGGLGVAQDYVEALKWANLAATLDDEFEDFSGPIADQLPPEQITAAKHLAREWKPKAWADLKKGLEAKSR